MKTIKVKNTYDIKLSGKPSQSVKELSTPKKVAVLPSAIDLIKPKLTVKVGDTVKVGTPVFFDKLNPNVKFLSPGSGKVVDIVYGPKRRIDEVIIELDNEEAFESFSTLTSDQVSTQSREDLVTALNEGGLWNSFRSFPFRNIPKLDVVPPSIYVSIDNDEPYMPASEVILQDRKDEFLFGLSVLQQLAEKVVVAVSDQNDSVKSLLGDAITHQVKGNYPAMNPGVVLYYTKKTSEENSAWSIGLQDVLRIAELFQTGRYPTSKIVVCAGELALEKCHYRTREGVPVEDILGEHVEREPIRYIAGGVLTGRKSARTSYLGLRDEALHVIREGKEPEMLTFFRPGFDKPTYSNTYLSALLNKSEWKMTTSLNGGYRSCISCGECPNVCPVDVLPQVLMKSIYAKDMEESISLGLLDCAECGLCTYICPSKIELDNVITGEKHRLAKEVI